MAPVKQGKAKQALATGLEKILTEKYQSMTWAQRLKRVFNIDIETCKLCGGAIKVIASIEEPVVIEKILFHLNEKNSVVVPDFLPEGRAPPQLCLFDGINDLFHKCLCMKRAAESTLGCPANRVETDIKYGYLRRRITNSDKVFPQSEHNEMKHPVQINIFFGKGLLFFLYSQ